jgi:hypothetical protein
VHAAASHTSRASSSARSAVNISFVQTRPTGAFEKNIGLGYGANLAYLFRVDQAGWFSLRADGGFAIYGDEHFHAPLSPTIGGRIQVKVNTYNNVIPLSVGPQLQWPRGPVRPVRARGVGGQYFFTESSVEGEDGDWDFASTTHQSDWTGAWVAGGRRLHPRARGESEGRDRSRAALLQRRTRAVPQPAAFRIFPMRSFSLRRWKATRT